MVKIDKIYTRGGDRGKTSLGNGDRAQKDNPRLIIIGSVDEANSFIGVACLSTSLESTSKLRHIQNDLFDLGADLCMPDSPDRKKDCLRVVPEQVKWLEAAIDQANASLQPLDSFILPGGDRAAAYLHVARTVVRRAEREFVTFATSSEGNPIIGEYLNRLSDYLFVLARVENAMGANDVKWVPGGSR